MWTWGVVFYNKKNYCNWCTDVSCESEMSPTTESKYMNTLSTLVKALIFNFIYVLAVPIVVNGPKFHHIYLLC